jgi:NAD(P)-dependent dehydrogenase (short-subunit alcohol dehydrogenase family)
MSGQGAVAHQRILVLGASGGVGREVVQQAVARGFTVTAQTRAVSKLAGLAPSVQLLAFDPSQQTELEKALRNKDVAIFTLATRQRHTTLFSDVTRAIGRDAGCRRETTCCSNRCRCRAAASDYHHFIAKSSWVIAEARCVARGC